MGINYGLVCPFLTDDPVFAHGVEIGLLYGRLQGDDNEIDDYFLTENQEQITLLCNRVGWYVEEMKVWENGPEWTRFLLSRKMDAA